MKSDFMKKIKTKRINHQEKQKEKQNNKPPLATYKYFYFITSRPKFEL